MLFRRTAALFAAATILSPLAPNALAEEWAYTQICLQNRGAYSAVLDMEIVELDPEVRWRVEGRDRRNTPSESANGGRTKCWDIKIPPGSSFRVFVDAAAGRRRPCVGHPDRRDEFEGFFLAPGADTFTNKTIAFRSWGTSRSPGCEPVSGEAMHSKCADESRGGFTQSGCRQWRPKVHAASAYEMANSANRPEAYLASVVRRGANVNATSGGNNATALHLAAQYGHMPHLQFLIENGANLNARERRGFTPLMLAIAHRQTAPVRLLLEAGADPNIADNNGATPLYRAMEGGMDEAVRLLAEKGANSGARNANGLTPLMRAVLNGQIALIQALLDGGVNPNISDKDGITPLYRAVERRLDEVARTLAKGGAYAAPLDIRQGEKGYGLAHQAAGTGDIPRLDLLAELGANLNLRENRGYTPLAVAVIDNRPEVVWRLLAAGADPNITDNDGLAPLYHAAERRMDEVARLLAKKGASAELLDIRRGEKGYGLAHQAAGTGDIPRLNLLAGLGADLNLRDNDGQTPLAIAVMESQSEAIARLLAAGADPNIADNDGRAPLYRAAEGGMDDIARLLAKNGASAERLNIRLGEEGGGLAHRAAGSGDIPRLNLLAELGADLNLRDNDGQTPLAVAVVESQSEAIARLLAAGVDPNTADNGGATPLHRAAMRGQAEVVQMLLEFGGDIRILDEDGKTALYWAKHFDHKATIKILRRAKNQR